jgi:hypothetical protein
MNTACREIGNTAALYCRTVDGRDEQKFRTIWAPNATYDVGGLFDTYVGVDQIVDGMQNIWNTFIETHHWVSNLTVEFESDETAVSISNGLAHMVDNAGKFVVCAFDYNDRYVQSDGHWLLAARSITQHYLREIRASPYGG